MGATIKNLKSAYETLILWGSVFASPTPSNAVKAGFKTHETFSQLTKTEKLTVTGIADHLVVTAQTTLADFKEADLPTDAMAIYEQMVHASAPKASKLVEAAFDPEKTVSVMLDQLTDPEHKRGDMQALFTTLTVPALKQIFASDDFIDHLRPQIEAQLLSNQQQQLERLDALLDQYGDLKSAIDQGALADLQLLGHAFGLDDAEEFSKPKLMQLLMLKAQELEGMKAQVANLPASAAKEAEKALTALDRLDLDAAAAALRIARERLEAAIAPETEAWIEITKNEALLKLVQSEQIAAFRLLERCCFEAEKLGLRRMCQMRLDTAIYLFIYAKHFNPGSYALALRLLEPLVDETRPKLAFADLAKIHLLRARIGADALAAYGLPEGDHFRETASLAAVFAIATYEELEDKLGEAEGRAMAGKLGLHMSQLLMGDEADAHLASAKEMLNEARALFDDVDAPASQADALLDSAYLLDRLSIREDAEIAVEMLQRSESYAIQAKGLWESLGDESRMHDIALFVASLLRKASIYFYGERKVAFLSDAKVMLEQLSEAVSERLNPVIIAKIALELAEVEQDLSMDKPGLEVAASHAQRAIEIAANYDLPSILREAEECLGRINFLIRETAED